MKTNDDEPLSNFAFNFNLRRYPAVLTYAYPCESKLTAAGTINLDIEGGEVKDLAATVTVYCPGMGKSRGNKAWRMSAYHEAELAAEFGGMRNLKVSHLSIHVEGKDSRTVASDVNAASWMPMASFAAVDVEGRITCRVVSGYNAEGSSQGMNIWFEKLAGAAAAESKMSMVQVMTFDFEGNGIEMHLTGELEHGCTPLGSRLLGAVQINKPESFVAHMSAEGVSYECDPSASPQVDIVADAAEAKIPALFITMESLVFHIKVYDDGSDGNATNATDYDVAGGNSTDAADALPGGRASLCSYGDCPNCASHI